MVILAAVLLLGMVPPEGQAAEQKTAAEAVAEMDWGVNLADLYIADVPRDQDNPTGYCDRAGFGVALWFWNDRFEWLAFDGPQPQQFTATVDIPRYRGPEGWREGMFDLAVFSRTANQKVRLTLSDSKILLSNGLVEALPALDGTYDLTASEGPDLNNWYTAMLPYDRAALPRESQKYNGARLQITFTVEDAPFVSPQAKVDYYYQYERVPMPREEITDRFLEQGVNVIRLPVSWTPFMDNETHEIDGAWLDAVAEEVRYILDHGAYCILNMHNDYLQRSYVGDHWESSWMDESCKPYVDARFQAAWQQIAEYFRDYPEGLILEACNEPTMAWTPDSPPDYFDVQSRRVNELNRIFYDTVRATGGGNATRLLCLAVGEYNQVQQLPNLEIPADDPYLIAQIHSYNAMEPYGYQPDFDYTGEIDRLFSAITDFTARTGVPVIIGETGVSHRQSDEEHLPQVRHFFQRSQETGVPCLWWEDCFYAGDNSQYWLYDKKADRWGRPLLLGAIREAVGIELGPTLDNAVVTVEGACVYNGRPQTPSFRVTLADGQELPPEKCTVTYVNNTLATTPEAPATLKVTAEGYIGAAWGEFSIAPARLTVKAKDQILPEGGAVLEGPDQVAADPAEGDSLVYVRLKTDWTSGSIVPCEVRLVRDDVDVTRCYEVSYVSGRRITSLEDARLVMKEAYLYSGSPIVPAGLSVRLPGGGTVPGDQLTVTVENNLYVTRENSPAVVTVTAVPGGDYDGSVRGTFRIDPAPLMVRAGDQEITYGEELAMGPDQVTARPAQGDVIMGIRLTATPEKTIVPSDIVIQRGDVDVTHCYSIRYLPGKLTVHKAQPVLAFRDYSPARPYNGRPLALPTPEQITGADYDCLTFTWYRHTLANANVMEGRPVDAGTYFLRVEAAETENTLPAVLTSEAIEITPRRVDVSTLTWTQTRLPFADREQSVVLTDLPNYIKEGKYSGNTGLYAGLYTASVELTSDSNHSLSSPRVTVSWRIVPASQTVTVLHGVDNPYVMKTGEKVDLSELVRPGIAENIPVFALEDDSLATLEGRTLTALGPGSLKVQVKAGAWDCNGDGEMEYAEADGRNLWITIQSPDAPDPGPTDPDTPDTPDPGSTDPNPTVPDTTDPNPTVPDPAPDVPCDGGDSCPSRRFTDVRPQAWYHEAVDYAVEEGLMSGTDETHFGPADKTSRAMLVTILYRMEGEPETSGDNPFRDVPAGRWYTDAVCWAAENGIVSGVAPDRFAPGDSVTRAQLTTILFRYAGFKEYDTAPRGDLSVFTDAGQISTWAREPMEWAVGAGLMKGVTPTTVSPGGDAVRAQTAAILRNFRKTVAK